MRSTLVCLGCGVELPGLREQPLGFRCPRAEDEKTTDHVLVRRLENVAGDGNVFDETNPYLRFRAFDHVYLSAREALLSDEQFVEIVRRLDKSISRIDGHGFRVTPYAQNEALGRALGFSEPGGVWVKNETDNVSGSHKGRHLFAVLVHLEIVRELGLADVSGELVIASCGNAALAAAVLARAAQRPLRVFVPEDADPAVLDKMRELGAHIDVCARIPGVRGDPTYHRFREAVRAGAIPFSCQGPDQALAVQGGKTLAWEMVHADEPAPQRVFVQVGGGALASAVFSTFEEAVDLGILQSLPQLHAVQTRGCFPLARAYSRLVHDIESKSAVNLPEDDELRAKVLREKLGPEGIEEAIRFAARNRNRFTEPWETTPHSLAHGILDDETYDWLPVVRAMLLSAGFPILVDENDIKQALETGRRETGIDVCATGTASLAGLGVLVRERPSVLQERVTVLFTGHRRDKN